MNTSIRLVLNSLTTALFVVVAFVGANQAQAASGLVCLSLESTLSYGSTGASVSSLQSFLVKEGYLNTSPTGHFGAATRAAVKTFQTRNGVSATGQTGHLTRSLISKKTCAASAPIVTTTPNPVVTTPASAPVSSTVTVAGTSNSGIVSPTTGQVLSIGSTTIIRWNASPAGFYNIVLERPGGSGAGFIVLGQSPSATGNQYVWNVGKVFSSQSNSNQNVAAGTYRLRIESAAAGATSNDMTSGWFTIVASQFTVSSVAPASIYADNATAVVLFGSGLTTAASVYFDMNYSGTRASNLYASPDKSVLVFTIPTSVSAGFHTLYIDDGYNSTPVSLPFTVSAIK